MTIVNVITANNQKLDQIEYNFFEVLNSVHLVSLEANILLMQSRKKRFFFDHCYLETKTVEELMNSSRLNIAFVTIRH